MDGRVCTKCEIAKPWADFTRDSRTANGHASRCKQCAVEYRRAYKATPEGKRKAAESFRKWRVSPAGKKRHREGARSWLRTEAGKRFQKKSNRKKKLAAYGLTPADYDLLVNKQDGKCAICQQAKRLVVDHCHATGKIRGLLCHHCNTGIGLLGEQPERFDNAKRYLGGEWGTFSQQGNGTRSLPRKS